MKECKLKLLMTAVVLAMLFTVLGGLTVSADTVVELANPGFESGSEGWALTGGASIVTTGAPDGNNYLGMATKPSNATSSAVGVVAGEKYYITCRHKASAGHAIYIKFFDAENKELAGKGVNWYTPNTSNAWKTLFTTVTAPVGAVTVKLVPTATNSDVNAGWDRFAIIHMQISYDELMANGGMETISDSVPGGWSFTGGAAGTNYSTDTTNIKAGTNSLKITSSETGSITASADCTISEASRYEVSAYFNLTGIAEGTDGAKLSVYNKATSAEIVSTSYFKLTDKGWRKMLVIVPNGIGVTEIEVKLILSGAGTVYFDDVSVKATDKLIDNGDLEGMTSDKTPTGWKFHDNYAVRNTVEEITNASNSATGIVTENGNNYFNISGNYSGLRFETDATRITIGTRYKLTLSYKGTVNEVGMIYKDKTSLGLFPASANNGTDWTHNYEFYFTPTTATPAPFFIVLETKYGSVAAPGCFDNITLEKAETSERLEFYQNGTETTGKYTGFADDYTAGGKMVTLFVALYEKVGDDLRLSDVKFDSGQAQLIGLTKAFASDADATVPKSEAPLELMATVTIPDGSYGEYLVKAFAWDGIGTISPYLTGITLSGD